MYFRVSALQVSKYFFLYERAWEAEAWSAKQEVNIGAQGAVIVSSLTPHHDRCLENLPQLAAPRLNLHPDEKQKYLYLWFNYLYFMLSAKS